MKNLFLIAGLLVGLAACSGSDGGGGPGADLVETDVGGDTLLTEDTLADGQDSMPQGDLGGDTAPLDGVPGEDLTALDTLPDTPQDTLWTDCSPYCTTPEGVNWVFITGGTFNMGCSPEDSTCADHELPAHSVTVAPFMIMEAELTEGQYQALVGTNPSFTPKGANYPVENLTWDEARVFCEAIGGRLPTEAEWEFAARGGTTTKYYCGDDSACVPTIGWCNTNAEGAKHPVKEKLANALGLYDTTGNVWEWVADWYAADYYATSPAENPKGPETGTEKVARGGSFVNLGSARVSSRYNTDPASAFDTLGLRCAK
jgi:formylglycine-generating enzyme required for sulfatase activity